MKLKTAKVMVCPGELNLEFKTMKIMCPRSVVGINCSMQEIGQQKPLRVASTREGELVLLDGFKRQLSAAGMNWAEVEIEIVGSTVESGIIKILSDSVDLHLHILEQSKFIGHLTDTEGYTTKQLANLLGKSVGWVSNRKNFSIDCPQVLLEKVFRGLIPSSSYAMTFRKFIQKWECSNDELTPLVKAVSGKNLSFRQVDELVTAYFTLENGIPEKIIAGQIADVLNILMPSHRIPLTKLESEISRKLEHATLSLASASACLGRLKDQSELTPVFKSTFSYRITSIFSRMAEVKGQLDELALRIRA